MELEEILNKSNVVETVMKDGKENAISACVSFADDHGPSHVSAGTQEDNVVVITLIPYLVEYIRFFLLSF